MNSLLYEKRNPIHPIEVGIYPTSSYIQKTIVNLKVDTPIIIEKPTLR